MSTKYWRVRHKGSLTGDSEWSDPTSFESTWKDITGIPADISFYCAIWTGSVFVVGCGQGSSRVFVSPDGINWAEKSVAPAGCMNLGYSPTLGTGQGRVVTTSNTPTNLHHYSDDQGQTWNTAANTIGSTKITWSPQHNKFMTSFFVVEGVRFVYDSTDGILFNYVANSINRRARGHLYYPSLSRMVVLHGETQGGAVIPDGYTLTGHSTDLVNFTLGDHVYQIGEFRGGDVVNGTGFVMAYPSGTKTGRELITSTDGLVWNAPQLLQPPLPFACRSFFGTNSGDIYGVGCASDTQSSHVMKSSNGGASWSPVSVPVTGILQSESFGLQACAYSPELGRAVIIGSAGTADGRIIVGDFP